MDLLIILLVTPLVLTTILLIAFIMFQGPQDDSAHGGVAAARMHHMKMISSSNASNFLEKITSILAASFFLFVLATSYFVKQHYGTKYEYSETLEKVKKYVINDSQQEEEE